MTGRAHQTRFAVLARLGAADALRALGLAARAEGDWLGAETYDPDAARAALRPLAFDWCVRAVDAPRPRIFVSDMDSSIIGQECIDELADFAGRKSEVSAITQRAMKGELEFVPALRARVAVLKGQPDSILDRVFADRVRLTPGARELVAALRKAGAETALVSGGFDALVDRVAREAGFQHSLSNTLAVEDGVLTGDLEGPIVDAEAKSAFLAALARRAGAAPEETVAMGDGANDVPMLRAAGFAIAIGGRSVALEAASAAVREGDLSVVIRFLGLESA